MPWILTAVFADFNSTYGYVWKENLLKSGEKGIKSNLFNWIKPSSPRKLAEFGMETPFPTTYFLKGLSWIASFTMFNIYINDLSPTWNLMFTVCRWFEVLNKIFCSKKRRIEITTKKTFNKAPQILESCSEKIIRLWLHTKLHSKLFACMLTNST